MTRRIISKVLDKTEEVCSFTAVGQVDLSFFVVD